MVLCSWANLFTLPMPLSAQEHKWVLVIVKESLMKCWGEGRGVILLVISCYGNLNKLHLDKPLATSTDLFPIPFILIYHEGSLFLSIFSTSQIVGSNYPAYGWIPLLIQILLIISVTVSFLTMGTGLKHMGE